jgi:hypothetical protein
MLFFGADSAQKTLANLGGIYCGFPTGKKKAGRSFAARRFPVYNLMKSVEWNQSESASQILSRCVLFVLMIQKCGSGAQAQETKKCIC